MLSWRRTYKDDNTLSIEQERRIAVTADQVLAVPYPAGDAFTDLVLEVARLGGIFTAAGESLAKVHGQTLGAG